MFYGFDSEIILHFYFHFKPFPVLRRAEREREREREREERSPQHWRVATQHRRELQSHIQAPASHTLASARAPIAHPSTDELHPSSGEIVTPQHRLNCHHPRPIHPKPISFSTQSSSAPPFSPSFSTADLSLFPSTVGFDEFFLLGFVSCVSIY